MADSNKETGFTGISPLRILLVDYDTDSTEILSMLLTLDGHHVEAATNGETALQTAGVFKPEVVLFETGIRDIEIDRIVKDLRWTLPELVLIALINWQEKNENPLHWHEAGFDHCLMKPVKLEEILALLHRTNKSN